VLHDNDPGAVVTDDSLGVNQGPSESSTDNGEDEETNVGAVVDRSSLLNVDVLAEGDL
jgi:hypothetical protein